MKYTYNKFLSLNFLINNNEKSIENILKSDNYFE